MDKVIHMNVYDRDLEKITSILLKEENDYDYIIVRPLHYKKGIYHIEAHQEGDEC